MKNIHDMSSELISNLNHTTSYENTKILVLVSRIYDKPWSNHRLELTYYSIRYKTEDKSIYVYSKDYANDDNFDFDCLDIIEFPVNFNLKIHTDDKITSTINKIKYLYTKLMGGISK